MIETLRDVYQIMEVFVGDKITYGRTHGKKYTGTVVKLNKMSYKVIRKEGDFLVNEYVKPQNVTEVEKKCIEQEVKPSLVSRLKRENEDLRKENGRLKEIITSLKFSS